MERPIAWNAYDESALSALEAPSRRYRDIIRTPAKPSANA